MWEFIQANSTWIVLGLLFLLMMRMHGGGMGCGGSHGDHKREPTARADSTTPGVTDSKSERREEVRAGSGGHRGRH